MLRLVIIDIESYYSDDFTLQKLSTEAYCRDPRFKAHGAAIKWGPDHTAKWYDERQLRYVLSQEDWSDVFLICHHTNFDGLILAHHYGVHPKMYGCTMSMARLLLPHHLSVALESVRKHFGMPSKTTPYNAFKGKHWSEMTPEVQDQVARGCEDEVESIFTLFQRFAKEFPAEEYEICDSLIRMFVDPVLQADIDLLGRVWKSEVAKKRERMEELQITEADVQSAAKFQELLEAEGVEIEYKAGKNGPIPQFAKSDEFMLELLEHPDDRIRTLAEARIGAKSTLLQTRAETLGWMARRGSCCVYLRYCGAATLRPTGGDGANWLNFKRGSDIRRAIMAPKGYLLAPVDSSQIEFRVAMYLAGQHDVLDEIKNGGDPYCTLASAIYNEEIYKPAKGDPRRLEMEQKRGAGKQGRLMVIYGAAAKQYQKTAKAGLYGPPVDMDIDEAKRHVTISRDMMPSMCAKNTGYWAQAERMIARLAGGPPIEWGSLTVKNGRIYLPSGQFMNYESLEYHRPDDGEDVKDFERDGYWRLRTRRGYKKLWGSKLTQNICEFVSRVIVSQAMIRLKHRGYRTLNWPYDELLLLIPDDGKPDVHAAIALEEMRKVPSWLPGLPLDAEVSVGQRYSK